MFRTENRCIGLRFEEDPKPRVTIEYPAKTANKQEKSHM